MTVPQLRDALDACGLSKAGLKPVLFARLAAAIGASDVAEPGKVACPSDIRLVGRAAWSMLPADKHTFYACCSVCGKISTLLLVLPWIMTFYLAGWQSLGSQIGKGQCARPPLQPSPCVCFDQVPH